MESRLCGCSFAHPDQTLAQGLEWVARHGFSHADLGVGGANGHFKPIEVAENPEIFAAQVYREAQRLGLHLNECFVLNFGWPINTPDLARRRETLRLFPGLCRFAAAAGCCSILLIPGPVHLHLAPDQSLELAAVALEELVQIASAHNLRLHVEADLDSCANSPETADALCRRVKDLFLTLDYSHFICQGIDAARIERLHPYTGHLHIRQAAPGKLAAPVDEGTIDFARVLGQLDAAGYKGLYCIEYLSVDVEQRTADMLKQLSCIRN
jgi:sugar phosphate isomerase/epimerase